MNIYFVKHKLLMEKINAHYHQKFYDIDGIIYIRKVFFGIPTANHRRLDLSNINNNIYDIDYTYMTGELPENYFSKIIFRLKLIYKYLFSHYEYLFS